MAIEQITIIGTGLIGGSFGLAVKSRGLAGRVIGCDREEILARAKSMGAIDQGIAEPAAACAGSQVVVLATPVGAILDMLERLGPVLPVETLLTDMGSAKSEIVQRAQHIFGGDAPRRFLPGHPMAGKEHNGIEHAAANLFAGAVWLVTPFSGQDTGSGVCDEYLSMVRAIGARVITLDAARHDRLCAFVSHLPQMVSTALAGVIVEFESELDAEFGGGPGVDAIGGRALREMTRVAGSSYVMWRDIALTNAGNIADAMLKLEQKLAHMREGLRTHELRDAFQQGNAFSERGNGKNSN